MADHPTTKNTHDSSTEKMLGTLNTNQSMIEPRPPLLNTKALDVVFSVQRQAQIFNTNLDKAAAKTASTAPSPRSGSTR